MIDSEKAVLLATEANRQKAIEMMNNELVKRAFEAIDSAARQGHFSVYVKGEYRREHIQAIEHMGFSVSDITEGGKDTNEISITWTIL